MPKQGGRAADDGPLQALSQVPCQPGRRPRLPKSKLCPRMVRGSAGRCVLRCTCLGRPKAPARLAATLHSLRQPPSHWLPCMPYAGRAHHLQSCPSSRSVPCRGGGLLAGAVCSKLPRKASMWGAHQPCPHPLLQVPSSPAYYEIDYDTFKGVRQLGAGSLPSCSSSAPQGAGTSPV